MAKSRKYTTYILGLLALNLPDRVHKNEVQSDPRFIGIPPIFNYWRVYNLFGFFSVFACVKEIKMNWKKFFITFFLTSIIAVAFSTLILGLFGFITAGKEGLVNAAGWGLVFGVMAIPFVAFMAIARAWEGYSKIVGGWFIKKQIEGDRPQPEPEEKYFKE